MALSNTVVLHNIFQYLPLRDLKSTRLVSSLWEDVSTPILKKKAIVVFSKNAEMETMPRFLVAFATTPACSVPFRSYKFTGVIFTESDGVMAAFWEKFGPFTQNLELDEVTIVGAGMARGILFNTYPNLKRISIQSCTFERQEMWNDAPLDKNVHLINPNMISFTFRGDKNRENCTPSIHWEEIFMAYPGIRALSIENLSVAENMAVLNALVSLKTKNPNCLQLNALNIFNGHFAGEITPDMMARLISLRLRLQHLSLDLGSTSNFAKVNQFFRQQTDLKHLKLHHYCDQDYPEFSFRNELNKLQSLELNDGIPFDMGFLLNTPNLTKLTIRNPDDIDIPTPVIERTALDFNPLWVQNTLTCLKVQNPVSSADMARLVQWLPRVLNATLYLENEGFRSVCSGWANLEELEVLGDKLTTEGITGIGEPEARNYPDNIRCLRNLRRFVMTNYGSSAGINDFAVEKGFLKLRCLNYLELCSFDISENGWTTLFNWTQLLTLKASNGNKDWEGVAAFTKIL